MQDPTALPADPAGPPPDDALSATPAADEGEASDPAEPADAAGSAPVAEALVAGDPVAEALVDAPLAAPAVPELTPAECAARLAATFPALFKGPPKPLKLRVQADIQQRAPGVFTRRSLSAFLHRHTTTTSYLVALSQAAHRFDLDGAPAGELSDEHRQAAVAELARRRAVHEQRRAAENAARRAAEAQARQAHAAADQARRERALLLRAYETSTLTRANFCALKRIAESELDALLATARQEAAAAPFAGPPGRRPDADRPPRPAGEPRHADRPRRPGGPDHPRGRPDGAARRPPSGKPPR
jgi:sRNA-binding protein